MPLLASTNNIGIRSRASHCIIVSSCRIILYCIVYCIEAANQLQLKLPSPYFERAYYCSDLNVAISISIRFSLSIQCCYLYLNSFSQSRFDAHIFYRSRCCYLCLLKRLRPPYFERHIAASVSIHLLRWYDAATPFALIAASLSGSKLLSLIAQEALISWLACHS